ncbi:MAG: HNH endonuclease [Alphaproteobacteria bacterium]
MRILERDDYRCCICGRRASDHVDIELHVHHIRPWGIGGLTVEKNLITLCHTCHNGLVPHHKPALFRIIEGSENTNIENHVKEYWNGVHYYQLTVERESQLVGYPFVSDK